MEATLFPDYLPIEIIQDRQKARNVMAALDGVGMELLCGNAERRNVVLRLENSGVRSVGELLRLHRGDVAEWPGVGHVFLTIFDEMRAEVSHDPESAVRRWFEEFAPLSFPSDLKQRSSQDDRDPAYDESMQQESGNAEVFATNEPADAPSESFSRMVENTFAEIIRLLSSRSATTGSVLRRYFLEGLGADVIARAMKRRSAKFVQRMVEHDFLQPLLAGETLCGLTLDKGFPESLRELRDRLHMSPATALSPLEQMLPGRFLHLLGMTLMERSAAEANWAGDLIVPFGAIRETRRLLRALLAHLQYCPSYVPEHQVIDALLDKHTSKRIADPEAYRALTRLRLRDLVEKHPWIEHRGEEIRLMAEHLHYDYCRIGRILVDADHPLTTVEVMLAYERRYFERPRTFSSRMLLRRLPAASLSDDGIWKWTFVG